MKVEVPKGKYVIAVSGGVDSIALLDLTSKLNGLELVVAHFNHGIRPDSDEDEEFVIQATKRYGLPIEVGRGHLGANTSEEKAREARYQFLKEVQRQYNADAIMTAHHQDDLIETAILNLLRGTGRRGLSAISDNPAILRPLLHLPKKEILKYAGSHNLKWREDSSNQDIQYLRNYIRHQIVPKLDKRQRQELLSHLDNLGQTNKILNQEIANLSQKIGNKHTINRTKFISLPAEVGNEVLAHILREAGIRQFDKKTIERLAAVIKTSRPGTRADVINGAFLEMTASGALLRTSVRS